MEIPQGNLTLTVGDLDLVSGELTVEGDITGTTITAVNKVYIPIMGTTEGEKWRISTSSVFSELSFDYWDGGSYKPGMRLVRQDEFTIDLWVSGQVSPNTTWTPVPD
jgi:hypothetical protein